MKSNTWTEGRVEQYEICQRRGHEPSGAGVTEGMGPTWQYCRWCNVRFRHTEPVMVEHPDDGPGGPVVPDPPAETNDGR